MSRERKRRRESIAARLAQFDAEDEARWAETKAKLAADAVAIHAEFVAIRAQHPLAMADAEEQIAREMAEVERYNRTHRGA